MKHTTGHVIGPTTSDIHNPVLLFFLALSLWQDAYKDFDKENICRHSQTPCKMAENGYSNR